MSKAIKERSARNSESEVNSNRSVSLGRQGRLGLRQFRHLCSPHLSRCPKFFFPGPTSGLIQLKPSWCIALTAYCQSRPESCCTLRNRPGGRQTPGDFSRARAKVIAKDTMVGESSSRKPQRK